MVRRKRDVAIIVLRCVIFGCCAGAQQTAFGMGMAIPPKSASGSYILLAQSDTPTGPQAIVQETKSAAAPAEPQAVMREIKSATRLSSSKQRRRKPKMAGVPAGSQVAAKEAVEPEPQATVKEAKQPEPQQAAAKGTKGPEPQAVALETEEPGTPEDLPVMAQKTKSADAQAKPQAETKEPKAGKAGKKYGMAPIKWSVGISETAGSERHSRTSHPINGPTSTTQSSGFVNTQTAEVRAKTYIMQPYIAQLGGGIGVVSSKNNSASGAGSRNNKLFGDGSLSLFARSRFPFTMSLAVDNDRNDSEFQTQDTVNRRLALDQAYQPLGSVSHYTGSYMRNTQTSNFSNWSALSGANPNNTVTRSAWHGAYSTSTPEHRIHAATTFNDRVTGSATNASTRADEFTLSDIYMPADSLLSLDSSASINLSSATDLRARFLQVNTNAAWQPEDEDIPLFVDGNVRLFKMISTVQGDTTSSQSLGGGVSARYLFSRNLTGNANGNVTSISSKGIRSLSTTQRGDVTYSSDAVNLWKNASYSWNANGGASNQTGAGSNSSVFGGVGHGLSIPYTFDMLDKKLRMNSRVNQSLSTNINRGNGQSFTLSNGGSVSVGGGLLASARPDNELLGGYGMAEGAVNTSVTLSVNDRRTVGGGKASHSRTSSLLARLQESSKSVYSRSGLDVEATLEAVQGTGGGKLALVGTSTIKYRKSRVLGVRGLDYGANLKISAQSSNTRVSDANAQNPKYPWEFDQRLRYRIGQNEVLVRGSITDQYGVKDASLWLLFRAWRSIGN